MRRRNNQDDLNRIIKTNLKYQTKEFFNNSTLHGVRYIAEEGRSFSEKFMWFCFVAIGAVSAFVIIASLWEKFQTNPTITDTDFHLHTLEFPSVILCLETPFNSTIVNDTAKGALGGYSDDYESNISMLEILSRLSYDNIKKAAEYASKIPSQMQQNWEKYQLRSLAFEISKKCEDIFNTCKFRAEEKDCCEIFQPIYSERGYCYSFNQRFSSTETTEERLRNFSVIHETDKSWSLELNLKETSKFYMHSVWEVFGYDNRVQFVWEPETSIDILISMKQTYTTDDAAQLTITQRKCIFPEASEVDIYYYKDEEYSLSSCMKECRMENAIKLCDCIPPFYAPVNPKSGKSQCKIKDFACLSKHASNITNIRRCLKCELSCLNTVYDIEKTSQTQGSEAESTRSVNIEFLTWPIIRYKREVLFGWVDLLVSFGGIAGLFLGFSLLSGVEIIYYFTVRATCMMFKNREQLYEVQEEEDRKPPEKYDLSMDLAKIHGIERTSNIRTVKPVDPNNTLDSSADRIMSNIPKGGVRFRSDEEEQERKINRNPFSDRNMEDMDTQIPTQRQPIQPIGIFRPIPIAPYSENIKPLDRNYRRPKPNQEESGLVYYGYLP
ncbi:unnamed protein product [Chironomus riparius]|uniref:Uncharacterized protein n=1 Tax=Chironomus riparius TaxID=315576 RepID=A0A9N9RS22_9DIPT|nr:unnamed protein product [Chironomus riparius]